MEEFSYKPNRRDDPEIERMVNEIFDDNTADINKKVNSIFDDDNEE